MSRREWWAELRQAALVAVALLCFLAAAWIQGRP